MFCPHKLSHCAFLYRIAMPEEWDFIHSWIALRCECLEAPLPTHASIGHRDDNTCIAPASPPPSIRREKLSYSPRLASRYPYFKRKRSYYCDTMPSPRKRTRTQDDQLSITTAISVLTDIHLPPTVHSRSSSPINVRANSPVHELRDIYRFATPPLKYTTSADEHTPQSVL